MDKRAQFNNSRSFTPPCRSSNSSTARQRLPIKDTVLARQKHFFESARTVLKEVHAFYSKVITQKNRLLRNKGIIQDSQEEKARREYEVCKEDYIKEQYLHMTRATVGVFKEDRGYEQEYKNLIRMYNELLVSHEELKMKHVQYVSAIRKLDYSTTDTTPKASEPRSDQELEDESCLSISSSSASQSRFSSPEAKNEGISSRVQTTPSFNCEEETVYLELPNRERLEQLQRDESKKIRQRFSLGEPARRLSFDF
jgi:hypothetical protein